MMSFKRILVPFGGGEDDAALAGAAAILGTAFSASITVLHVRATSHQAQVIGGWGVEGAIYAEAADVIKERADQREQAARAAFDALRERLARRKPQVTLHVDDGYEPDILMQMGSAFDLILMGRPDARVVGGGDALNAALFYAGRPVIVVGSTPPETLGTKIVVAWNRSAQSARALACAMPILEKAEAVRLFHVETGAKRGPEPSAMVDYLSVHGIEATADMIPPDHRPIGEQILDEAEELGADLIVMGAYSHSRLRELILGGVTKQILASSTLPVLMTH